VDVRAKFQVTAVDLEAKKVSLRAVASTDPESENHKFWEATPAGSVELLILNQVALDQFEEAGVGHELYVDFWDDDEDKDKDKDKNPRRKRKKKKDKR
jgi:hypothetical protein